MKGPVLEPKRSNLLGTGQAPAGPSYLHGGSMNRPETAHHTQSPVSPDRGTNVTDSRPRPDDESVGLLEALAPEACLPLFPRAPGHGQPMKEEKP